MKFKAIGLSGIEGRHAVIYTNYKNNSFHSGRPEAAKWSGWSEG